MLAEPFTQTRMLNEEMKNPHLVETLVRVLPMTGRRIQNANVDELGKVLVEKMLGQIPVLDVNFNVQGLPMILTRQSYLELRLHPVVKKPLTIVNSYGNIPLTFEFNRALWPKVNVACVESASASFSNFGVENTAPLILPYIRTFQQPEDLRLNNARTWNPSYLAVVDGNRFVYANRYLGLAGSGAFESPTHRSPYQMVGRRLETAHQYYTWFATPLMIQIPLEDILPVFQVPVIPLRQTNTSNFSLRLKLRSPRHMFFSARYFNPDSGSSFLVNGSKTKLTTGVQSNVTTWVDEYLRVANAADGGNAAWKQLSNVVVGGGTLRWLQAVTVNPFAIITDIASFDVDFNVDCELVLRVLTNPMLNPLVQRYIEPFINEMNEFTAHFTDYYVYTQQITTNLLTNNRFSFTPSQLFYNTTHVALFFMQDVATPYKQQMIANPPLPSSLSGQVAAGTLQSLYAHGHFVLRENIDIKNFQVMLGSSCVPLFDRPLDMAEMLVVTEEALKKYSPTEMYGDVMFIQNRLQEGDAFFLFDLTHARNSGFFIDADNMMRVEGTLVKRESLVARDVADAVPQIAGAAATGRLRFTVEPGRVGRTPARLALEAARDGEEPPPQPDDTDPEMPFPADEDNFAVDDATVHVLMVLLWQNTFNVLLDLDGAVLFQQQ